MNKINHITVFLLLVLLGTLLITNRPEKANENFIVETQDYTYKVNQKLGLVISVEDQEFTGTLHCMLEEMDNMALISDYHYAYEEGLSRSEDIWSYVCQNVKSEFMIFEEEDFCNLELEGEEALEKILSDTSIDLILSFGTKAGQLLINDSNKIDTLNILAEDAVGSGITDYKMYSGKENLWVLIDNNKHLKKLNIFYNLVEFKKLGVIRYADSFRRSFTPEATLTQFAKDKDIEVVYYDINHVDEMFSKGQIDLYYKRVREAHSSLAEECDAFYMIVGGWNPKDIRELLKPIYDKKIPVVSAVGNVDVTNGALLGVGKSDFEEVGDLTANNIAQILRGIRPNELIQVYDEKQAISYNVDIGKEINFAPDIKFLMYCDDFVSGEYEE